ncbi:MAG: N-formylglutamate amidohydrolase [Pseudomonadota bacterium]
MTVISVEGPERPGIPLLLDSPHSGTDYPNDFRPLVDASRYRRAEDMDVDALFGAAPSLGVPLLKALFPRVYVDVNRALADISPDAIAPPLPFVPLPSAKARLGKGVIWTDAPPLPPEMGTDGGATPLYDAPLPGPEVARRLSTCWTPYRRRLADLLDGIHEAHGRAFYLDCHSMQSVSTAMHEEGAGKPRPDVVLGDRDGSSCDPAYTALVKRLLEAEGFAVSVNDPYKGADLTIANGRPAEGYHALQIELRRDLYMDEVTLERNDRFEETRDKLTRMLEGLVGALRADDL